VKRIYDHGQNLLSFTNSFFFLDERLVHTFGLCCYDSKKWHIVINRKIDTVYDQTRHHIFSSGKTGPKGRPTFNSARNALTSKPGDVGVANGVSPSNSARKAI
jgi:hypothetical protein